MQKIGSRVWLRVFAASVVCRVRAKSLCSCWSCRSGLTHICENKHCKDSLTTCCQCLRRVLVLHAGFCETCNAASAQFAAQCTAHRVEAPKLVFDNELNWTEVLTTGRINGYKVTEAMVCERLKQIGQWESKFRLFNKDNLVNKLLFYNREKISPNEAVPLRICAEEEWKC